MDLSLDETQQQIQDSTRDFVRGACSRDTLVKLDKDPAGISSSLWPQIAEMGWMGMALPEEYGGTGNSLTDVAVLFEELGMGPVPGPHFSSGVLCARLLLEAGRRERDSVQVGPRPTRGSGGPRGHGGGTLESG